MPQLALDDRRHATALDPRRIRLRELLADEVIGRGAGGRDCGCGLGQRKEIGVAGGAAGRRTTGTCRPLRERLGRCVHGKFACRLKVLRLRAAVEVGKHHAVVVVDPAALKSISPRHPRSHPAGVERKVELVGAVDDHAGTGAAGVVELLGHVGVEHFHREELRVPHRGHMRHRDAPNETVVVEEHPLVGLRPDLIFLQIRGGEQLEIIHILIGQQRHPVAGLNRQNRGQKRRQRTDDSRNAFDTGVCSHRYVSWGAGAVCSADADCSSGIGHAGRWS